MPVQNVVVAERAVKLAQLEVFVVVVEQGGIRAAARHLGLSQAAVTKAMRLLEQETAIPLVIRKSREIGRAHV